MAMSKGQSLSVLIAEDHNIVRYGLRQALNHEDGITVVAEACNGREAIKFAADCNPDIIIMDVSMPELNGIEATRRIMANCPQTKVIALSIHSEKRYVIGMMKAGAKGYLLKTNLFEQLVNAIRTVAAGNVFLCPDIAAQIINSFILSQKDTESDVIDRLSPREREVLQLISEGKSSRYISDRLCISKKTVNTHKQNIMHKLEIHNIAGLTKFALKHGITSLDP